MLSYKDLEELQSFKLALETEDGTFFHGNAEELVKKMVDFTIPRLEELGRQDTFENAVTRIMDILEEAEDTELGLLNAVNDIRDICEEVLL